jgi:sugar (pentulose or hexulose) kinase
MRKRDTTSSGRGVALRRRIGFLKALALDTEGVVCGFAAHPTPLRQLPGGLAEDPVEELERCTFALLRELTDALRHRPIAIATTSMGETGALVAERGDVVHGPRPEDADLV